jgi:hypothetical protein
MSKNRSAAGITNIVQYDANKNITFVSGSTTLLTVSSSGALTTTSTITAQTLVVQTITSSVNFVTGSTKFGAIVSNTHQFTGSLNITGSLSVVTTGTEFQVTNTGVRIGNVSTDVHPITGSVNVSGSATFSGSLLANGIMSLGDDGTYGSTYKTLGLTGNANGSHRILAGTADDLYIAAATSRGITFLTNGTNTARMTILPSGSVGIGTSYDRLLLNIGGNIALINSDTYSTSLTRSITYYSSTINYSLQPIANINFLTQGDAVSAMTFTTRSSPGDYAERMRITSVGNVGIGVTSPSYKFHTVSPDNNTTSFAAFSAFNLSQQVEMWYGGIRMGGSNTHVDMNLAAKGSTGVMNFITNGSTRMQIDGSGNIGAPSGTNIYNASDLRLKRNISTINDGLNKIMELNPVKFNWIENYVVSEENKDMLGFIAQEIQEVIPEAVESFANGNTITIGETLIENPLRVNEKFIIPVLVKAIQELKAEIDALKAQ